MRELGGGVRFFSYSLLLGSTIFVREKPGPAAEKQARASWCFLNAFRFQAG